MTAPLNVAAAQDALARLDEGHGLAGDETLAADYELFLQHAQWEYVRAQDEAERAAWLAGQCPVCVPDGSGPECDEHYADWDKLIERSADV